MTRGQTLRLRAVALHLDAAGNRPAPALHQLDVVLAEEGLDALCLACRRRAAARQHAREVDPQSVRHDAARLRVAQLPVELGVGEDGLRRDAAPVAADTADALLLHHGGPQAELCRADRGHVSAGARTDDRQVQLSHASAHPRPPRPRLRDQHERRAEERHQLAQEAAGQRRRRRCGDRRRASRS